MSTAAELFQAQVTEGKSLQQISDEIGYSRTTVSLYNSGQYRAGLAALEAAIVKTYDKRLCTHTGELIEPPTCERKALSPKPFGGSARLAWWICCQSCPHKPEPKKEP